MDVGEAFGRKTPWHNRHGAYRAGRGARARVFGLEVFYHNRNRLHADLEAETGATYVDSLDRMLRKVDIVSVNCPHTPATYHLLSARRLGLLPPHATVINTSRGEVIDEGALADALSAGRLGGAGLDVFEREPAVNPRLLELENVVLLPHMSSATMESRQSMGEKVIINIKTFADGHRPPIGCCRRMPVLAVSRGAVERIGRIPGQLDRARMTGKPVKNQHLAGQTVTASGNFLDDFQRLQ